MGLQCGIRDFLVPKSPFYQFLYFQSGKKVSNSFIIDERFKKKSVFSTKRVDKIDGHFLGNLGKGELKMGCWIP